MLGLMPEWAKLTSCHDWALVAVILAVFFTLLVAVVAAAEGADD